MASKCRAFLTSTKYDVTISNVTLFLILVGVFLTTLAFFYPVEWDYTLDPKLSAAENEERRIEQVQTQDMVYALSISGMVLVTVGGLMSSVLLTKYILLEECVNTDDDLETTTQKWPPFTSVTNPQTQNQTSGSKYNHSTVDFQTETSDGQKNKLVESDYLQSNVDTSLQYGSTG